MQEVLVFVLLQYCMAWLFKKETGGDVTSAKDAKIAVYSCTFDGMIMETRGTVLLKNADGF